MYKSSVLRYSTVLVSFFAMKCEFFLKFLFNFFSWLFLVAVSHSCFIRTCKGLAGSLFSTRSEVIRKHTFRKAQIFIKVSHNQRNRKTMFFIMLTMHCFALLLVTSCGSEQLYSCREGCIYLHSFKINRFCSKDFFLITCLLYTSRCV